LPGLGESEITAIHQVLEIGCGPGTWSMELAQTYYHQMRVTGVDTNPIALSYATAQARKRHLDNVGYLYVRDLAGPYTFPDDSFDLISAQFLLSNSLSKHSWLRAMRECWRLLRPGGWLRLTDFEVAMSNAPANEELALLFIRAMHRLGYGVSPSDRHLGILCEMEPLLIEAGFSDVRSMSHMINYSSGAPLHEEWKKDFHIFAKAMESMLVETEVATSEQIQMLERQAEVERNFQNFRGLIPMLTVWGKK
jgi:ubiquinone/menaquinone biosynthesis C-methylase UbiE